MIGYTSDALMARGADSASALRSALLLSLLALIPAAVLVSAAAVLHTRQSCDAGQSGTAA